MGREVSFNHLVGEGEKRRRNFNDTDAAVADSNAMCGFNGRSQTLTVAAVAVVDRLDRSVIHRAEQRRQIQANARKIRARALSCVQLS